MTTAVSQLVRAGTESEQKESRFSTHRAQGILGYSDPDITALIVATDVLSGSELYFWKRIRGAGLAHGAEAWFDIQNGHMGFEAWRSPNAAKAFMEAKEIVRDLVDGKVALDPQKLQAAKNSGAYYMAERVSSRSSAASDAFVNRVLRGRSSTWIQERLAAVQAVTAEETLAAMKKYILPLFDPETSVSFIVCGPTQVQEIAAGLKEVGYEVDIREMDDKVPWDNEEPKDQGAEVV